MFEDLQSQKQWKKTRPDINGNSMNKWNTWYCSGASKTYWNFHGIFCIKVSSGWMFLMSPWVGYSWWHWTLWKLENTENEAVVLALRVCVIVVMCVSNSLGKSIWFLVAFYVVSVVPVTSAGVPLKAKFEWLISSKWRWSIRRFQFRPRESYMIYMIYLDDYTWTVFFILVLYPEFWKRSMHQLAAGSDKGKGWGQKETLATKAQHSKVHTAYTAAICWLFESVILPALRCSLQGFQIL